MHLDLSRAPYAVYGVTYTGLVSLTRGGVRARLRRCACSPW